MMGLIGRHRQTMQNHDAFGFLIWIAELSKERQVRIVGLFPDLCALEGHNKQGRGNKYKTFDSKMAAVAFAHRSVRNARINYKNPEFELIALGYKRTNSHIDRKQPVTAPMLREMHRGLRHRFGRDNGESSLMWGSIVLAFFFLDRSSELCGPVAKDTSTGGTTHYITATDVIVRNRHGAVLEPCSNSAHSVDILFRSHKSDKIRQGNVIRHYRSGDPAHCPRPVYVCGNSGEETCRLLDQDLTSINPTSIIKKSEVTKVIK
ncbi:hypothetical protein PHMEG_00017140 [Phytophthora megakarya]|uniref:Uncharacterized protein n=1 Tax=Phytophthora megakarya TaxID=4795 RepID=A0A225VXB5_9STRA|nr:hypothetical protein PHMEG_00017140 [Phytophthora megakarya]